MTFLRLSSLITLSLLAVSTAAYSQSKDSIAKCASLKESVLRLECFDNIAKALGVDAPLIESAKSAGAWKVTTEQSPLDDTKNVYLSITANDSIHGKYGKDPIPTLLLRCKEKKTDGFINFDTFLGSDSTDVTIRMDKDKAQTSSWSISTDHNSAFIPKPLQFIKSIMNKSSMLVQVTPYGESPVMTSFDIQGLSESIKPLQEACAWK